MKKLGMVGGMGPEGTLEYYKRLNYGWQRLTGDNNAFPAMVIESVNVYEMLALCGRRDYDGLEAFLLRAVENLARAGADFAALAANTPHIVYDRLVFSSPLPLVSIVEATAGAVAKRGLDRVGLLGTLFTMQEDFFKKTLAAGGIATITPAAEDMERVNARIAGELERGIVRPATREYFVRVIAGLVEEGGAQGIILGCTELPLLLSQNDIPVPAFDTLDIHVESILRRMAE